MANSHDDRDGALSIHRDGHRLVASGEVDMDSAAVLADALSSSDSDTTLDMSGVGFLDSSGLRVLIQAHQDFEARGARLVILDPSPQVARIFDLSQLGDYFSVQSS